MKFYPAAIERTGEAFKGSFLDLSVPEVSGTSYADVSKALVPALAQHIDEAKQKGCSVDEPFSCDENWDSDADEVYSVLIPLFTGRDHECLTAAIAKVDVVEGRDRQIALLRKAVAAAQGQFEIYGRLHRAADKIEKAETNEGFAATMAAALKESEPKA